MYIREIRKLVSRTVPHIYYTRSCTVNVCPRRHLHACASRQGLGSNARLEMPLDPPVSRTQCPEDNIAEINYTPSRREREREITPRERVPAHECHVTREIIMHYITSTACVRLLPTCTTISINWRSKCMFFPHYVTKRCNMRGN